MGMNQTCYMWLGKPPHLHPTQRTPQKIRLRLDWSLLNAIVVGENPVSFHKRIKGKSVGLHQKDTLKPIFMLQLLKVIASHSARMPESVIQVGYLWCQRAKWYMTIYPIVKRNRHFPLKSHQIILLNYYAGNIAYTPRIHILVIFCQVATSK